MKKLFSLLFTVIIFSNTLFAIRAYFHSSQFYAPSVGSYLETYLAIVPNSLIYRPNQNTKLQGSVDVIMLFYTGETIVEYRKYTLKTPEIDPDQKSNPPGFIDLQRIPLNPGTYNFELRLKDNYSADTSEVIYKDIINISLKSEEFSMSGIEPVERIVPSTEATMYTKSGYDIFPYVSNFYPENINVLTIYAEIYNIDKEIGVDTDFLVRYYISSVPSRRVYEFTASFERRKAAPVIVLIKSVDISKLPSGNYNLEIEVRTRGNELLLSRQFFFQRSSKVKEQVPTDFTKVEINNSWVQKYNSVHELAAHIKSLYPIADLRERQFIEKDFSAKDITLMQQFFLNFWETRNSVNPESEWEIYRKQVELVNRLYGNQIKQGYMTDRGRVYLQYGPPNQVIQRKNLSYFQPYEIWHYYRINEKINRRFVFSLLNFGSNDYDLVHSDMPGEITTQGWIEMIKGRAYLGTEEENNYRMEFEQIRRDYQD